MSKRYLIFHYLLSTFIEKVLKTPLKLKYNSGSFFAGQYTVRRFFKVQVFEFQTEDKKDVAVYMRAYQAILRLFQDWVSYIREDIGYIVYTILTHLFVQAVQEEINDVTENEEKGQRPKEDVFFRIIVDVPEKREDELPLL